MKWHHAVLIMASVLTLPGCTYITSLQSDVSKQIDRMESEQQYGQALDVLALIPRTHPEYAKLAQQRLRIEAKARSYEQATIRRAGELVGQNRWAEAQDVYRQALDKLPGSEALRADLQEFRRKQAQRVQELKTEQLLARAQYVERTLPVQEAIVNTDPNDSDARGQLKQLREEATQISDELTRIGLAALDKDNLGMAGRTLPVAARLTSNPVAASAKDRLGAAQAREQRATQEQAIDRLHQQESERLLAEFRQLFQAGDLRRSRQVMARLQEIDGKNPDIIQENDRLKKKVDALVKRNMDEGVSLYGRGRFQDAVDRWNKVLELDPDNQKARNSLERAGRVMEKLRQLREKQSASKAAK